MPFPPEGSNDAVRRITIPWGTPFTNQFCSGPASRRKEVNAVKPAGAPVLETPWRIRHAAMQSEHARFGLGPALRRNGNVDRSVRLPMSASSAEAISWKVFGEHQLSAVSSPGLPNTGNKGVQIGWEPLPAEGWLRLPILGAHGVQKGRYDQRTAGRG